MTSYNLSQIVSIDFTSESVNTNCYISEERSFIDWVLQRPKKRVIREENYTPDSSISIEKIPEGNFIRDNKIFNKASLTFRFSNRTWKTKYFDSNDAAEKFKERIESNNFIKL
jgi:hypothetical protein